MIIRVLIIDDDKIELNRFINAISWGDLGFELIGTAFNGIIGYNEYLRLAPDLVITDIEMPGMSGIELAEKIRKNDETTKIVFLSSHEKFEYAHSGYELAISDYILKQDFKTENTCKKLLRIRQEIIEVNNKDFEKTEEIIFNLINSYGNNIQSRQYLNTIKNKYFALAIFEETCLPFFNQLLNNNSYKKPSIIAMKKVIQSQFNCLVIPFNNDGYLTFAKVDENDSINKYLDLMCLDLLELLNNSFNRSFYIIKLNTMSVLDVKEKFNDYYKSSRLRYFYDNNSIIDASALKESECLTEKVDNIFLKQLAKSINVDQLKTYIDHIFAPILKGKKYNAFNENIHYLCFHLGEYTNELIDFDKKNIVDFFEEKRIMKITTMKLAIDFIKESYEEYFKLLKQKHNFSIYVENAIQYIYQNYNRNSINLGDIAENVALSPTRLRTVFKKETGKTIHQYITDIRLDKAKQLLQDDKQKKLNQIAKEVGYLNGKYLSRVFKREIGITPETFRMRNTNEED